MRRKTAEKQAVRAAHEVPLNRLQVTLSNALTNAAQGLTLAEKRLMMFAVGKLNNFKNDGGTPDGSVKLTAEEYATEFGVSPDTAYDQLQSASKAIYERSVRFYEGSGRSTREIHCRWVSACEYAEGMGYVKLYFTSRIAPHLLQLKGKFTSYKLAQANALRSIYSWRLLELLSQFKSTGWRQIPIAEFCHAMEATEKQRNDFAAIRRKIIEPAVKELIEKDGWLIEWQPIKEGRKVAAIRFEFRRDPQGRLDL
jgi:plasmid replication initiation protein